MLEWCNKLELRKLYNNKYDLSCKWKDLAYGSARVVVLNDTDENIRLLTGFRTINILNGAIFEKINFGKTMGYDNERKIVFNSEQAIALLLKEKIEFKENLIKNPEKLFIYKWIYRKKFNNFLVKILKFFIPKFIRRRINSRLKSKILEDF